MMSDEVDRRGVTIAFKEGSLKTSLPYLVISTFLVGITAGALLFFIASELFLEDDTSNGNVVVNSQSGRLAVPEVTGDGAYSQEYLDNVINTIQQRYLGEYPNQETINYELVKGYIEAFGDKYTNFLDPEEAEIYRENRTSSLEGIGVRLGYENGNTVVESVLKGYPAEGAGVLNGDFIVSVDEEDVEGKRPEEVAQLIRGEAGTDVTLTIMRPDDGSFSEISITITRAKIDLDNVMWSDEGDGIVEIDIVQFVDQTVTDFNNSWDKVVEEINEEVPELNGIVVDLRSNPGGYVFGVRYVLEEFLDTGDVIMHEESRDGDITSYMDNRVGAFEDVPVVVIVNEGSASASEIFAAAVQDNDRGTVIGTETVGKGVEQELIEFQDGTILIVVFQRWLTPDKELITEESPIQPDEVVEITDEDIEEQFDRQLERALEILR